MGQQRGDELGSLLLQDVTPVGLQGDINQPLLDSRLKRSLLGTRGKQRHTDPRPDLLQV